MTKEIEVVSEKRGEEQSGKPLDIITHVRKNLTIINEQKNRDVEDKSRRKVEREE